MKKLLSFLTVVMAVLLLIASPNTTSANTTMTRATESQNQMVVMQTLTMSTADVANLQGKEIEPVAWNDTPPAFVTVAANTQEQSQPICDLAETQWRCNSSSFSSVNMTGAMTTTQTQFLVSHARGGAVQINGQMFAISMMSTSGQPAFGHATTADPDALLTSFSGGSLSLNVTMNLTTAG